MTFCVRAVKRRLGAVRGGSRAFNERLGLKLPRAFPAAWTRRSCGWRAVCGEDAPPALLLRERGVTLPPRTLCRVPAAAEAARVPGPQERSAPSRTPRRRARTCRTRTAALRGAPARGGGRGFVVRVSRRASRSLPTVMMGTSFFQGEYEAALTIYDEHVSPPLPQRAHPCGPSQKRRLPREHASRGRRGDFTPPREFLPEVVSSPRLG